MKNARTFISFLLVITLLFGMFCTSSTVSAENNTNTNVDFIFIIDSTGSMRDYINNVNKKI